jgi:hypothetical protein
MPNGDLTKDRRISRIPPPTIERTQIHGSGDAVAPTPVVVLPHYPQAVVRRTVKIAQPEALLLKPFRRPAVSKMGLVKFRVV